MNKKILLTSAILMSVLGLGAVSTLSHEVQCAQEAELFSKTNRSSRATTDGYLPVVDPVVHNTYGLLNETERPNVDEPVWTYSEITKNPDTGENTLYASVVPFTMEDTTDNQLWDATISYDFHSDSSLNQFALASIGNILQDTGNSLAEDGKFEYSLFGSPLAVMRNGSEYYYGYSGYLDLNGNFVPHALLGMPAPNGTDEFDWQNNQEIVFRFDNVTANELTDVEIGTIDGLINLNNPTEDDAYFNRDTTIATAINTWEDFATWPSVTQAEFISISGKNNDSLNNTELSIESLYADPVIADSFELSNLDHDSIEVTFDANYNTEYVNYYQTFLDGGIGSVNNNINFYYDNNAANTLDAELINIEDDSANLITTYTYELDLTPDKTYSDIFVDITYENDDGVENSFGEIIPKTRTHQVSATGETIQTRYDNPFDLASPSTKWNDENGQILAHIALNTDDNCLPLDPSTQNIELKYRAGVEDTGTFGDGVYNLYDTNITVAPDGTYMDIAISNPNDNHFIPITELDIEITMPDSDGVNGVYEYELKSYSGTDPIGDTTPIKSLKGFEISGDKVILTFNVDLVNGNAADTKAELESSNITFGYDSVPADQELLIDENAQPIYPTTGTAFTSDNVFTVDETNATATVEIDYVLGEYSNLWMQVPGVFRQFDKSGTVITTEKQNPIMGNSGEIESVTTNSARISFLVNDDDTGLLYGAYDPEKATFTAKGTDGTEIATFVSASPVRQGTTMITYDFTNLKQGHTYSNIAVELEYTDDFVSDGPRVIIPTLTTGKESPIVANSGSIVLDETDATAVDVTFEMLNEPAGEDLYGNYIPKTAVFNAGGFDGLEKSSLLSENDLGTTTELTYKISGLKPNTTYSDLTVDFTYLDNFDGEPTIIVAGSTTTSRLNPIIERSGSIISSTEDSITIKFDTHHNPNVITGNEDFANFDPEAPIFTGTGLTGSETTELISTVDDTDTNIWTLTYEISGLQPGTTYSDIYVNYLFEDSFVAEPTLVVKDSVTTDKLNPIIEDSGVVTNITSDSATISFDVNNDIDGEDKYADYIPTSASFSSATFEGTEKFSFIGSIDNGTTTTVKFNATDLKANQTYTSVSVLMDYRDGYMQLDPVRVVSSFQTLKENPIVENSGLEISSEQDSATISFVVNNNSFGENQYASYDPESAVFTSTDFTGSETFEFISEDKAGSQSTLTYLITGLEPSKTYLGIDVSLDYTDGSTFDAPTRILERIDTAEKTANPIIESSFWQDFDVTTEHSATFSFQYRMDNITPETAITAVGYGTDSAAVEFEDYQIIDTPGEAGGRGEITVIVNNLPTKTTYDNIWVSLEDEVKIYGEERTSGENFSLRTNGLQPIIEGSGNLIKETDTSAEISYNYNANGSNGGDYYEFNPEDVTLGYVDEASGYDVAFLPSQVEFVEEDSTTAGELAVATYTISGLKASTTYSNIFVKATTNDGEEIELDQTTILGEFTTLGANPLFADTIEMTNVIPSDGTEAELKFMYRSEMMLNAEGDKNDSYSVISLEDTLIGYESSSSEPVEETRLSIGDIGIDSENTGGIFDSEFVSVDTAIDGFANEATFKITGLEADVTYSDIYVIVYDEDGNELAKTYALDENASFTSLSSDPEIELLVIVEWMLIAILFFIILFIIILFAIRYAKKHFALAIFMDAELSLDESEIVFNLANVKHVKKLWEAYEGNLVLYAAGRPLDAIFKRSTELHNGYKIYLTEDFDDKDAIFSILTSTKYGKFSVGLYNDHQRFHVTSVPSHKAAKLAARLDRTDFEEYDEKLHEITDNLDGGHIEEKLFESIEGFVSGINRSKSTDTTLRYQAVVPHDHSLNHELFFEENEVSFWHVHDGKQYELRFEFISKFGSLVDVDLIDLQPGTVYVGIAMSFDKGKTFIPSSTVYGITRTEDGIMPNLTNAVLGKRTSKDVRTADIWDEETAVSHIGERLTDFHKRVITKKHYEDETGKILSKRKADEHYDDYINKWWKELKENKKTAKPTKATKSKTKEIELEAEEVKAEAKKTTAKKTADKPAAEKKTTTAKKPAAKSTTAKKTTTAKSTTAKKTTAKADDKKATK